MKIGIDARFYRSSTGGIGRYTRALLKQLSNIDTKNQYTVFITPEDVSEYNIEASNFKAEVIDIKHYTYKEQLKFLNILNKHNFDIVHFTNFNYPVLYNKKFVVTIHDLTLMLYPQHNYSWLKKLAFSYVIKKACFNSTLILADSLATKEDIVNNIHVDQDKIKVVHIGLGNKISKEKEKFDIIEKKYKLHKPYLLFVSQWRPHKGLPDLIKAFEILKEEYKIPHDLLIGGMPIKNFPEISETIKKSKYAKYIITPGFTNDKELNAIYENADLFVFPSHYEGFGLPPLEAMQRSIPVVSSNLSCMPEILGDAAVFFDPRNHKEMAKIIFNTINDNKLKEILVKKGLNQAKKYSWEKMARETLGIYKSLTE